MYPLHNWFRWWLYYSIFIPIGPRFQPDRGPFLPFGVPFHHYLAPFNLFDPFHTLRGPFILMAAPFILMDPFYLLEAYFHPFKIHSRSPNTQLIVQRFVFFISSHIKLGVVLVLCIIISNRFDNWRIVFACRDIERTIFL